MNSAYLAPSYLCAIRLKPRSKALSLHPWSLPHQQPRSGSSDGHSQLAESTPVALLPHSLLVSLPLISLSPLENPSDLVPQTLSWLSSPAGNPSNKTRTVGAIAAVHQLNRGIRFSYHQWVEAMCVHGQRTAPRSQRFTPIHHCSYWTTSGKSPHPPVVQLPPVKTGIASSPCTIY